MDTQHPTGSGTPRQAADSGARPRVVVGVDGSDGARAALRYAFLAAARRQAALDVVVAYPVGMPWRWDPSIDAPDVEGVRADLEARAGSFGAEVRTSTPGVEDVPVTVLTAPGAAARVLVDSAQDAALLVVGSHGRGAVRSAILGSVALHVVSDARCPVVVVHQETPDLAPGAPVVVGLDDSTAALGVLQAALDEAARLGTDVLAVTAYGTGGHWGDSDSATPSDSAQLREDVRRRVDAVIEQARRDPARDRLPVVRTEFVEGSAYDVLPDRARGAPLLVVGRRGHSAMPRLVLGSVALHAVVRASCPVMVVHPAPVPSPAPREPVAG